MRFIILGGIKFFHAEVKGGIIPNTSCFMNLQSNAPTERETIYVLGKGGSSIKLPLFGLSEIQVEYVNVEGMECTFNMFTDADRVKRFLRSLENSIDEFHYGIKTPFLRNYKDGSDKEVKEIARTTPGNSKDNITA